MLCLMSRKRRYEPPRPPRAKRNVRWALIALVALSIAPASAPEPLPERENGAIASDDDASAPTPTLAADGDLQSALDLGADLVPTD